MSLVIIIFRHLFLSFFCFLSFSISILLYCCLSLSLSLPPARARAFPASLCFCRSLLVPPSLCVFVSLCMASPCLCALGAPHAAELCGDRLSVCLARALLRCLPLQVSLSLCLCLWLWHTHARAQKERKRERERESMRAQRSTWRLTSSSRAHWLRSGPWPSVTGRRHAGTARSPTPLHAGST